MILAIVKVLPEPVTPSSTWCFSPSSIPRESSAMAAFWSPFRTVGDGQLEGHNDSIGGSLREKGYGTHGLPICSGKA